MDNDQFRRDLALLLLKAPNKHKATLYDVFLVFGVESADEKAKAEIDDLKTALKKLGEILSDDTNSHAYKVWRDATKHMNL